MKVGLISDIHCNLDGLSSALQLLSDCDEVLCAGDLLYQYRFSVDVLALIKERGIHAIVGNHDKTILYSPAHPLRESPSVDQTYLRYLSELPDSLAVQLGGLRIAMFHGAPWDVPGSVTAHYVYPHSEQDLRRVAQVDADVVVLGHTHRPFATTVEGTLIVNPGSCDEPRDGSGLLSCAVLETLDGRIEFRPFSDQRGPSSALGSSR